MIIGISGKVGSGKDTIAKLMNNVIAKKQADEGVGFIQPYFEVRKFAGKLKQVATLLTGVPVEKWEDQEFKKRQMPSGWNMTYREFLQKLGTDAMRNGLHENIWVNALFADYQPFSVTLTSIPPQHKHESKWIIADVRFPNEANAIKERGGVMIRVNRNGQNVVNILNGHPSETALDNYDKFDFVIDNNGSIEELEEKVRIILKQLNTI